MTKNIETQDVVEHIEDRTIIDRQHDGNGLASFQMLIRIIYYYKMIGIAYL